MKPPTLGISTSAIPGEAADVLGTVVDLAVDTIDLWQRPELGDLAGFVRRASGAGIPVRTLSVPRDRTDRRGRRLAATWHAAHEAIRAAASCGIPTVQFYVRPDGRTPQEAADALVHWLKPLVRHASDVGVTVLWENNLDHSGWDPAHVDPARDPILMRYVLERLDTPAFRCCFDPANVAMTGRDPLAAYRELCPWIACVHVKDARPVHWAGTPTGTGQLADSDGPPHAIVPPGRGVVPWDELATAIGTERSAGWLVLDPVPGTDLPSWVDASRDFLARAFGVRGRA